MEDFKIKKFEAKKSITFPWFRSLSSEECSNIARRLKTIIRPEVNASGLDLVKIISSKSKVIENYSSEDKDFDLTILLNNLSVAPKDKVYLNWYPF